jgi:hypothetical protein
MHDEGAAELNEEELMIYGSGRTPDSVEGVAELTIASRREPEKNHAKS